MKCKKIRKKLDSYHYGLENIFWKIIIKKHLLKCPDCQKEYSLTKQRFEAMDIDENLVNENILDKKILNQADALIKKNEMIIEPNYRPLVLKLGFALVFAVIIGLAFLYEYRINKKIGKIYISNSVIINNKKISGEIVLYNNAQIKIPKNSHAEIEYKGIYKIKLYKESEFSIVKKSKEDIYIKLAHGTAYFDVNKNRSNIKIETVNSIIKIVGTSFLIKTDKNKKTTRIEIKKGSIEIYNKINPDMKVVAINNQMVEIKQTDIPSIIEIKTDIRKNQILNKNILQEKIYLKNGKIMTGTIINQNKDAVILKTKNGKFKLNVNDIEKIEYIQDEVK